MDFLLTRGLDSGLDSTDVYIYKGALLPVELLRLQHFIYFLASGLSVSGICHYIEEQGKDRLDILSWLLLSQWSSSNMNFQPRGWLNTTCTIVTCSGL